VFHVKSSPKFLTPISRRESDVSMTTFSRGTLDPWYVTGFVEGEGAFTYSRSGSSSIALYFAVKLTGADRQLLEELQDFFGGIGRIYRVVARAAPIVGSGFTKEASYYRVTRKSDLERVIEHFDLYPLRGTKARSYAIWRELVLVRRESGKATRDQVEELCARLSAAAVRNQPFRTNG
jgi:hypothetical protein